MGDPVRSDVVEAVHRSWWSVDRDYGVGSELLFTEDAICAMPAMTMRGRAEIAAGYAKRQENGPRLSRHLVSNLVVDAVGDAATARYVLSLYAGNGVAPLAVDRPSAICDVEDRLRYVDGEWLLAYRELTAVFVPADNDSVMLKGS